MWYARNAMLMLMCLSLTLFTSGCASKYGSQTTKVERYPQCYAPIQQMREEENIVARNTAGGAAIGAIGGALFGLLLSGGKAEGAIAGAAVGGISGAAIGYSQGKRKKFAKENERMASYMRDLQGDIRGIDASTAGARVAIQCYEKEFNTLLANYKHGTMTKMEVQTAYTEIKNGLEESERILGGIISSARDRDKEYQAALEEESKLKGQPVPQAQYVTEPVAPRPKTTKKSNTTEPPVQPVKRTVASSGNNSLQDLKNDQERLSNSIDVAEKVKLQAANTKVTFQTKIDELES